MNSGSYGDSPRLAELYDLVPGYAKLADIDFYVNECLGPGGKTLELGCGTGRVLLPIAESGIEITGLDISEHMLSICRNKLARKDEPVRNRVKLVHGDMTAFNLEETFNVVIIPFRPFQHLITVSEQMACLSHINRHLPLNGRLIFNVFQVNFKIISSPEYREETEDFAEFTLPDGRRLRRTHRIAACHRSEQYNEVELIYYLTGRDGAVERLVHAFPFRYFFRYELEHMLERNGFRVVNLFGDFDKSPLTDSSPEMVFIAEKYKEPFC
jgi:ubiquinone/menaquinone biosynthesis C-methylase UbiE